MSARFDTKYVKNIGSASQSAHFTNSDRIFTSEQALSVIDSHAGEGLELFKGREYNSPGCKRTIEMIRNSKTSYENKEVIKRILRN